jgi:hypothetical protein
MAKSSATRARPKEIELQVQVVDFLEYAWPKHLPWWHVPNGEKRDHKTRVDRRTGKTVRYSPTGQKLKAMGLKPGVADLCFVMPNGKGAFLELKRPGEDLSEDQEKFRDAVRPLGCGWAVADNFDVTVGLRQDHPAAVEGRTIFPRSVVGAADSPRLLVSGHNNSKLGKEVLRGSRAGWPIFHLTLEERATCPRSCPVLGRLLRQRHAFRPPAPRTMTSLSGTCGGGGGDGEAPSRRLPCAAAHPRRLLLRRVRADVGGAAGGAPGAPRLRLHRPPRR